MDDPRTGTVDELSDRFVADLIDLSPMTATYIGRPGGEDALDDLSPDGLAELRSLHSRAIAAIERAGLVKPADDLAKAVILERLGVVVDKLDSGWAHANLNVIDSPIQLVRTVFDLMPTSTEDDFAALAGRMRSVPGALAGYQQSLKYAADRGFVSSIRQVDKCAAECLTYSGVRGPGYFNELIGRLDPPAGLLTDLAAGAAVAESAYRGLAAFLLDELRPKAPEVDAVGADRYVLASREFLGASVDLQETYEWGWQEFLSLEAELRDVADRILPGSGPSAVARHLDEDERYRVVGSDGLQRWMQDLTDRAVEELGASHFDIPEPIRALRCRIAPPGGGLGAYYTGPSDDLSRPGQMWWSVEPGRQSFSTWRETTTVYHEGVPGHHLQVATAVLGRGRLNDYQRLLAETSGHGEGWALYAERLVRDLGYLNNDGELLGMLDGQLFRAARVVLDIGMHLQLEIPREAHFHPGERWTPELGLEFLLERTLNDPENSRDEIDRYLGWPGQAPAYKIGERVWLAGRDAAQARHGSAFDVKDFHTRALQMGGMGLEPLAAALNDF